MEFKVSRDDIMKYAKLSGDFNPIHIDPNEARKAGFKDTLVHGAIILAWIVEYLYKIYGERIYSEIGFEVRFISPLFPDERARIRAEWKDEGREIHRIYVEKENGERVATVVFFKRQGV